MTGVLTGSGYLDTQTPGVHAQGGPCEETARGWPSASQGERKATMLAP